MTNLKTRTSLIVLLLALAAMAAPQINGAAGTISHGQDVTITGLNFGTRADYDAQTPYLHHRFEDCENGSIDASRWTVKAKMDATNKKANSSHHLSHRDGSYSLSVGTDSKKFFMSNWTSLHPNTKNLPYGPAYAQFKTVNIAYEGGKGKTYSGVSNRESGARWGSSTEDGQSAQTLCTVPTVTPYDTWHRLDLWAMAAPVGNKVQFSIDTKIYRDGHYTQTRLPVTGYTMAGFMTYMKGDWSACPVLTDDHYIDMTQARVELADKSVLGMAGTRANIQLLKAWSSNSITIEVNTGTFNKGDKAWLFVIDENGNRSQGFEVTIGGENQTRIRLARQGRTNGQMDQWTNGSYNILGRRMVGNQSSAMRTVVVRSGHGKTVRVLR